MAEGSGPGRREKTHLPLSLRDSLNFEVEPGWEAVDHLGLPGDAGETGVGVQPSDLLGWQEPARPGQSHGPSWFGGSTTWERL